MEQGENLPPWQLNHLTAHAHTFKWSGPGKIKTGISDHSRLNSRTSRNKHPNGPTLPCTIKTPSWNNFGQNTINIKLEAQKKTFIHTVQSLKLA